MSKTVKAEKGVETESTAQKSKSSNHRKTGTRKGLGWISKVAYFISIVALCLAVYAFWQNYRSMSKLAGYQNALEQQKASLVALELKNKTKLKILTKQVNENFQQILATNKSVQASYGNKQETWHLAEADHLMRAANIQLQTSRNVRGAMQLLRQANEVINSINDYSLFSVKKGLEEDIATLSGAAVFDTTGIWLQLNAAMVQVKTLPLLTPENSDADKVLPNNQREIVKNNDKYAGWFKYIGKALQDSWHFFSSQFYLRKHDNKHPVMLLSSKDEFLLKQKLQLMLAQTQQALLISDVTIYKKSLENVLHWINVYFRNNSPEAKSLLAKLTYLTSLDIVPPIPDITHGLKALEGYYHQSSKSVVGGSGAVSQNTTENINFVAPPATVQQEPKKTTLNKGEPQDINKPSQKLPATIISEQQQEADN